MPLFLGLFLLVSVLIPVFVSSHTTLNHVVISELMVTGATATDEFIELFNPTDCPVSLEGWKLTKKTASGTESNLVASLSGTVAAHGHILITHQTGYQGGVTADTTYSGGSYSIAANNAVLLYADQAKTVLVDRVGFSDGITIPESEGSPAVNPSAGTSLTRVDGQDSDNNAVDFEVRIPSPANAASGPVPTPGACTVPPPPPPAPPSSSPPSPGVAGTESISGVRSKALGVTVSTSGVVTAHPGQLSTSYFYIQDETGGIQVYSSSKSFPSLAIGDQVEVGGVTSEANSEKRIRIGSAADVRVTGRSTIAPRRIKTGEVGEALEGQLVKIVGMVDETSGDTFYLSDGSPRARVLIQEETGIDKPRMEKGDSVTVVGIVSQYRETYRVMPRLPEDFELNPEVEGASESVKEEEAGDPGQASEASEAQQITGVTFTPITSGLASLANQPVWVKGVAWGAIGLGGLLLALLPFLLWAKRNNWKLSLPKKLGSSSNLSRKV